MMNRHAARSLMSALSFCLCLCLLPAAVPANEANRALGERLVAQFYEALSPDSAALEALMDDSFQIIGSDGLHFDREEYLSFPKAIVDFTIDDLVVRRDDTVLTVVFHVTYHGGFEEGARTVPSLPRLAVFTERDEGWRLVALAALGTGINDVSVTAAEALGGFFEALSSGDAGRIEEVLSPDFQVMHADGTGATVDAYLAEERPADAAVPVVSDLVATSFSNTMVARYRLTGSGIVGDDGGTARMTVFQRIDGTWLVAAHAGGLGAE